MSTPKSVTLTEKAIVKPITVKASPANKTVVSAPAPVKAKADSTKAIEKHIKEFEPLELFEGLGFNAVKVYTVHNVWAKTKPLIEHLGKDLKGKLKDQLAELSAALDAINPNGS